MLEVTHKAVMGNSAPPPWPEIIPVNRREKLRRRTGLRDRLVKYTSAYQPLNPNEQKAANEALSGQNRIEELLSGRCDCTTLPGLPEPIRNTLGDLFEFAFDLLTDLKIR